MCNHNPQEVDRVKHMKTIEKKETWCDSCGRLVPAEDIYYITKEKEKLGINLDKQKVECVCKDCLSFVKKPRGINYEGRLMAIKEKS